MRPKSFFLVLVALLSISPNLSYSKQTSSSTLSNNKIKEAIIMDSIANYSGNCPCPYNVSKNGSRCGRRSAYTKPGGESPVCYRKDVTLKMIEEYKKEKGL